MSSFIVKFRSPSSVGQEGVVYYRIIHKRNIRQITTNYKMYEKEWKMLWGQCGERICHHNKGTPLLCSRCKLMKLLNDVQYSAAAKSKRNEHKPALRLRNVQVMQISTENQRGQHKCQSGEKPGGWCFSPDRDSHNDGNGTTEVDNQRCQ